MDTDELLYQRAKQGDLPAFDELYTRYAARLFGFVRPQVGSRADAEDIFHETFLRTLESAEVRFDRGSFRTWLFRIARNAVLNRARGAGRAANAFVQLRAQDAVPTADEQIAHGEMMNALSVAIQKLPLALSEVYHLRSSGLSYEEIATILDAPMGTVKSRMHQMVNVLREELKPWTAR